MREFSKSLFTIILQKSNYITQSIKLLLLIFTLFSGIIYYSLSLKKCLLSSYYMTHINLKTMLENSIVKKHYYLLTNKYNEYKNFGYINQLVKLRAELLQIFNNVKDINLILYDQNGKMIFSNFNLNIQGHYYEQQVLTSNEIDSLLSHQEIFYNIKNRLISIFPIFYENNAKPSFFLKIFQEYNTSYITIYNLFLIFISLLLIILVLIMYYLNTSNTRILAKQHKTNIELQQVKEVLEQENRNKLKFFASVTHELRTPLNAVIGFAELIRTIDDTQYKEYADEIHNAGIHLLSLINDVLDFSKAESSSLTVEKTKFNLNKIIDSCLNMLAPKLKVTGISLKKEIPPKQLLITADPKRMKQVIINLLSNSIKFTPKNGLIRMVLKENIEKNLLIMEFHDNGIGIMQQDIYKVMSVFGQADSGYRNEGTGIGLPLSKKLVELMGGTFEIKSESNYGTTIILNFFYEEQTCEDSMNF
ncbi:two-component sensor histidine kinase [Wolbachia pipientis]|uniref:histidine kinase n=1 Tax=Wolbachia pipientis TaxID=955 RepID=A0A1E7QKW9_WOLPI|nr:HAMP domain-containing sensor histidine kinase [Wolbachia pipientis]OEY86859.1 two-component sensor histidine kinase [Wolbachia pipientis]